MCLSQLLQQTRIRSASGTISHNLFWHKATIVGYSEGMNSLHNSLLDYLTTHYSLSRLQKQVFYKINLVWLKAMIKGYHIRIELTAQKVAIICKTILQNIPQQFPNSCFVLTIKPDTIVNGLQDQLINHRLTKFISYFSKLWL